MYDFRIEFSAPLLLLLLIPALFFALFPYFRTEKRYRRTRNRIISMVLHSVIMVLAVLLLSGMSFSYKIPNTENEIILLVDASDSTQTAQDARDDFVYSAIDRKSSAMKMGIVLFGYNQIYAVPLTYDADELRNGYGSAELPDDTATDFQAALLYASRMFENPESAKIVLVSDGDETDGNALSVVRSISADGIQVDTVCLSEKTPVNDVRVSGVAYPEETIAVGETFNLSVTVEGNYLDTVRILISDNGEDVAEEEYRLTGDTQTFLIPYAFPEDGLHALTVEAEVAGDGRSQNNRYCSYYYLQEYNDILIVERSAGESSQVKDILTEEEYNVTVMGISDSTLPTSVNDLRRYDEVILVNISNADMPEGFDSMLNSYVYTYGGSLFTVGGKRIDAETQEEVANAYNRDDMRDENGNPTLYQQMLPVEAIDYTPPVAVVFIIDCSGSMTGEKLELAKDGAFQSIQTLTSRDWVGVISLQDEYSEELALTPVPQLSEIEAAIDSIESNGGTNYTNAFLHAGSALSILSNVQKRHIILISDAQPGDNLWDNAVDQTGGYGGAIKRNYEQFGITCSIVSVTPGAGFIEDMKAAVAICGGNFYEESNMSTLAQTLTEDLRAPNIIEYNPEPFTPKIRDITTVVSGISQSDIPQLGGYYGTRIKSGASQPLVTPYEDVPVYAQWNYGAGKVGSFMSDLSGAWAEAFLSDEKGIGAQIVKNIIKSLYPTGNIRPQEITFTLSEQNYTTQVNIFGIQEGESVRLSVSDAQSGNAVTEIVQPTAEDYYSSASFIIREAGVYLVTLEKLDAEGNVLASATAYKAFSYSSEYKVFTDEEQCRNFLASIAERGEGASLTDAGEIFDSLQRMLPRETDPRVAFAIVIIVLFLLDVAVRKFKFKWPHEIVRERREAKSRGQAGR